MTGRLSVRGGEMDYVDCTGYLDIRRLGVRRAELHI